MFNGFHNTRYQQRGRKDMETMEELGIHRGK